MAWQDSLTIAERKHCLQSAIAEPDYQTAIGRGEKKLSRWQQLGVLNDKPTLEARLQSDALQHNEFLFLLGLPAANGAAVNTEPDWLVNLKHIYADGTGSKITNLLAQEPALGLVAPLVQYAMRLLDEGVDKLRAQHSTLPFDPDTISGIMVPELMHRLKTCITPTLIQQLNVDRILGKLDGDTPAERYQNFLESMRQPGSALKVLCDYPVLAKATSAIAHRWLEVSLEFLDRICTDWQCIRNMFEICDADPVIKYDGGAGDSHNGGRSVAITEFESGLKLVYKPRPVSIDARFQHLVTWLNNRGNHRSLRTLKVLDRGQYGWVEHVAAKSCSSEKEVRKFYEQMGGWLALFHGLRARDFHHENFIASGQDPVPVDIECLFQPTVGSPRYNLEAGDPTIRLVEETVLQAEILPQRDWRSEETAEGVDLGALQGPGGAMSAHKLPVMERSRTDEIRLVRKRVRLPGSNNKPNLNGITPQLADYTDDLVTGFEQTYRLLTDLRDSLLASDGPLQAFSHERVRLILVSTQAYANLLNDGFHPHLMRDALERELLFDRVWNLTSPSPRDVRLVRYEKSALEQGDIPLFFTTPASRNIYAGEALCIENGLEQSGLDAVKNRIRNLGEHDLVRQRWLIRATVASTASFPGPRARISFPTGDHGAVPDKIDYLEMACRVGDRLGALSFRDDEFVSWFEPVILSQRHAAIEPVSLSLYDGLAGITLFLAYLGRMSGQEKYTELAQLGLATISKKLQSDKRAQSGIGAFFGLTGMVYLYTHLGAIWQRSELLEEAELLLPDIERLVGNSRMFDILGGSAGAILCLIALHETSQTGRSREIAVSLGNHLVDHAADMASGVGWHQHGLPVPLGGFSHGAGGIALALLKLDELSEHRHFRDTALRALAYERSTFNPKVGNWRDLREKTEIYMTAWCHGAPGIALSRLAMLPILDDDLLREEIAIALKTTGTHGLGRNHCLCHGALGNLEPFLLVDRLRSRSGISIADPANTVRKFLNGIFASVDKDGWLCGNRSGIENPGLMTGISGMGFQMLRLAEPARVPSVLLLEPPMHLSIAPHTK